MRYRSRARQWLLIVIAVLLPAGVLIGLAQRVIRQEAELAEARAVQEHQTAVEQLGREFSARLEAITLQEINRWIRVPAVPDVEQAPDPALVFVAALDGDRLVLPWESSRSSMEPPPEFLFHRREGEVFEFLKKDFAAAAERYGRAMRSARRQNEICDALLLEARALVKLGKARDAAGQYKAMLRDCDAAFDDDGIAYSLYAAERLIHAIRQPDWAFPYITGRVNRMRWIHPYEAYMIRGLLKSAKDGKSEAAAKLMDLRIAEMDQIRSFAKDFQRVRPLAETGWAAYGGEPWLVRVIPADPPLPSLVFALSASVASQKFLPSPAALVARDTPGSEPLGDGFSGVHMSWPRGRIDAGAAKVSTLYTAGIAFILAITVLAGYLLLRDVNRDVRMAELRSHFVASVSHELKTPLTAIRMFAETLALGRARDERTRSEYLETIVNESERLTRLVDNVLDFSKIEQGKRIYQLLPTRLADVFRSAAQAMQYPLSQQGFTLNVAIDDRVGAVSADADAMQQAILNLLSNAMKYSGSAREIDLCLKASGGEAVIEVIDRGMGIDPHEQPRVFERFYRGRPAETGSIAGTGLGLTLVQHIAEGHGGRVELKSVKGVGSTFSIHIPMPMPEVKA